MESQTDFMMGDIMNLMDEIIGIKERLDAIESKLAERPERHDTPNAEEYPEVCSKCDPLWRGVREPSCSHKPASGSCITRRIARGVSEVEEETEGCQSVEKA